MEPISQTVRNVPLEISVPSNDIGHICCNNSDSHREKLAKFDTLKVVYTNSRSLRNKSMELEHTLLEEKANLVVTTETWFSADREINFEGYEGYFCSRNHRRGGCVAVYVDSSMVSATQLVKSTSMMGFDMVIIKTSICDKDLLYCLPST